MATYKSFKKDLLHDLTYMDSLEDDDGKPLKVIQREQTGSSRWNSQHEMIFEYDGLLYSTTYECGLTECQDTSPYEFEGDEIQCEQVVKKTRLVEVTEYVSAE